MAINDLKTKYEKFYQEKAALLVAEFNAERKTYRNEAIAQKIFMALLFFILLSLFSLLIIRYLPLEIPQKENLTFLFGIGLFIVPVCILPIIYYLSPQKTDFSTLRTETKLKNDLMPAFMNIFGNFTWQKKDSALAYDFNDLRKTKIVPQNITAVGDDSIRGVYEGVNLKIIEMHIGQNSLLMMLVLTLVLLPVLCGVVGLICLPFFVISFIAAVFNSAIIAFAVFVILIFLLFYLALKFIYQIIRYFLTSGRFKGMMAEFDMPKSFSGHTFIYENAFSAQPLRNSNKSGFEKVELEDVDFSKRYTIYSTNQTEARYVLTPAFIERLKNISFAFKAKYLRMSFQNNKMILLAATDKDLFMMGNPFKDSDKATFDILFDEISSVLCLVDQLKLQKNI